MAEVRNLCDATGAKKDCFLDSPLAWEMGIKYPFIQGAMSWITDSPEFASAIADAGGLPTIALGQMDAQTCDRRLGRLAEIMSGRPYALNIISLAENPLRETQTGLDKTTPAPFCLDCRRRYLPHKRIAAMRHWRRVYRPG